MIDNSKGICSVIMQKIEEERGAFCVTYVELEALHCSLCVVCWTMLLAELRSCFCVMVMVLEDSLAGNFGSGIQV